MEIGPHLKQIRLAKHYTLNDVAGKINISASLLSQVENGKASPSLQSLENLLRFYAVNLSDFFRQVEQKRFIIVRKEERDTCYYAGGDCVLTLLASKLQNNALESFLVELKPDAEIEVARLGDTINGERILVVIENAIEVILDGSVHALSEGDSVNFKSYVPCTLANRGSLPARLFVSGLPPIFL